MCFNSLGYIKFISEFLIKSLQTFLNKVNITKDLAQSTYSKYILKSENKIEGTVLEEELPT